MGVVSECPTASSWNANWCNRTLAGDRGDVRLLRAPCIVNAAPAREGHSHVDRVGCVRFLNGGTRAVSAGVYDRLLVLWEIEQPRQW